MKLHLGCGNRVIPGYAHIDVVPWPHVDVVHSVDSLPWIDDDSIEVIYACHVLEHFHRRETARILREWHRVLAPAGVLRLSVPDFRALSAIYMSSGYLPDVLGPLFGRGDYLYNVHHTVFDLDSLSGILLDVGFSTPRRYDWRATEHAHIDDYSQAYIPHMDKENGTLISLNIETTK